MVDLIAPPRAFVLGWPISHSRSPMIHGHWIKAHGLAGSYERIPVPPEEIGEFLQSFPARGFVGGNVTVPHKEVAFAAADRRDASAIETGAANTLWMEGGKLCVANTDPAGFLANLDDRHPGWDKLTGRALVLGAGGAARAIVWALCSRGLDVAIVNRTETRAEELAARFSRARAYAWSAIPGLLAGTGVLVNATSLGMSGKSELTLALDPLPQSALVTDIVYVPLMTPLLIAAAARGNPVVDGLGMLLHQAVPGFERWFGVRPTVTSDLRELIVADLKAKS